MSLLHHSARLPRLHVSSALTNPTLGPLGSCLPAITLSTTPRRFARNKPFASLTDEELSSEFSRFRQWAQQTFSNAEGPTYLGQFDLRKLQRKDGPQAERDQFKIFPENRYYKAQPVLTEEFKDEIVRRIKEGASVRRVSMEMGVSMERVAAVVRLREIRGEMEKEGKELNNDLSSALTKLMPQTALPKNNRPSQHDPANSFLVPSPTAHLLFTPLPESRKLTSSAAAKLLGVPSPDELIPHPELLRFEAMKAEGISASVRRQRAEEEERRETERMEVQAKRKKEREEKRGDVLERGRWRWRLREASVGMVGERYGVPKEDRKGGNGKGWLECRHYAYGI